MNLITHIQRQRAFSKGAFGPHQRVEGVCDHIHKELIEVLAAHQKEEDTLPEWVDIILLALDGAWRTGASPHDICSAIREKQEINENREWPDWRKSAPGKAIEHVGA